MGRADNSKGGSMSERLMTLIRQLVRKDTPGLTEEQRKPLYRKAKKYWKNRRRNV